MKNENDCFLNQIFEIDHEKKENKLITVLTKKNSYICNTHALIQYTNTPTHPHIIDTIKKKN